MTRPAGTELALIPGVWTPATLFRPGNVEDVLSRLERDAAARTFDVSTEDGRAACRSYTFKLVRSRTTMDGMGKALTEEWRTRTNAVNAERRTIRDRMEQLEATVRAPLTAFEDAEKSRVAGHEAAIAAIPERPGYGETETAAELQARLDYLQVMPPRDWREFAHRATETLAREIERTVGLLARAVKREAEAAELAQFRAEQARVLQQAAERARLERDAKIAEEAAQRERVRAEQVAAEERQQAAERQREADLAAQRAEERALRAEQGRIAAAEAAEQRRADEALAAEARREAQAVAAEQRRIEEAEAADRRQAEAVAAERQRIADEQAQQEIARQAEQAEAARRAANRAHQAKINSAALSAMILVGVPEKIGKLVISAVARGDVPRMRIDY